MQHSVSENRQVDPQGVDLSVISRLISYRQWAKSSGHIQLD